MIDYNTLTDMEVVALYNAFNQSNQLTLYFYTTDEFKNTVANITKDVGSEYAKRIEARKQRRKGVE